MMMMMIMMMMMTTTTTMMMMFLLCWWWWWWRRRRRWCSCCCWRWRRRWWWCSCYDDDDDDDVHVVVDDNDDYYYDGLTKLELLRVFRVDPHAAALHPSCTRIKRYPSQEQLGRRPRNRTISVVIPTNWRHWYCLFRHVISHNMFWHLALLWYFMPHMLTCHLLCMYIYIYFSRISWPSIWHLIWHEQEYLFTHSIWDLFWHSDSDKFIWH